MNKKTDPSPEEIREECEAIRSEWDADTFRLRTASHHRPHEDIRRHNAQAQDIDAAQATWWDDPYP